MVTKILGIGGCGCNIAKQKKNSILLDKENVEYNLDSDINFVIAGLGGNTTMNHLKNLKLNKDKLNIGFFILPFKIEKERRSIAVKELKKLKNKFSSILLFDNDFFVKTGKENIVKLFKNVNKFVNESINSLIESINYYNIVSLDYQDFVTIFSSKKIGIVQKGIFEDKEIKKEV
jgi:cell division GTPase FtsZ